MNVNNTATTSNHTTSTVRSVFFCPQLPEFIWDLNNTTFAWILVAILLVASPVTVLLNSLVIVAMKKKRELHKHLNILLCSMAVTDLLTGAITMPLSATVDVLILSQSSFDHICTLDILVNRPMIFFLSTTSLYHLTAIAWERYMAIQKWIDYRNKVTKRLLKKLAMTAWLLEMFAFVLFTVMVVGVGYEALDIWAIGRSVVTVSCLIAIAYFYIMVFLGVRKRKQNQTSKVTVLMKAKLESKLAKTTGLLTAAIIFSFVPLFGFATLSYIFPALRRNSAFRLGETLVQLNSLVSPILYCFRDHRFRNAALELLGMSAKSGPQVQQPVNSAQFSRRKHSLESVKLVVHKGKEFSKRLTRSASTEPIVQIGETLKISLGRSMSDPALSQCFSSSFSYSSFKLEQPSSILKTSAVIHRERQRNSKGKIIPGAISPTKQQIVHIHPEQDRNPRKLEPASKLLPVGKMCKLRQLEDLKRLHQVSPSKVKL